MTYMLTRQRRGYLDGIKILLQQWPHEELLGLVEKCVSASQIYGLPAEAIIIDVAKYIEIFYNRQRLQTALGYLAPAAFVRRCLLDATLPNAA
jgi:hypothetical protein